MKGDRLHLISIKFILQYKGWQTEAHELRMFFIFLKGLKKRKSKKQVIVAEWPMQHENLLIWSYAEKVHWSLM